MLRAALSKEDRSRVDDVARDEENFRSGLKRNIVQLSNLARVNKEELARLREQLKARDGEILDLKERVQRADREEEARERNVAPTRKANATARLRTVVACGNMAIKAGRLANETRQRLKKSADEPSEQQLLEEKMAVAEMGAKHTEQHLLRASRDIRGQLERALQEAEALRADNNTLKSRASIAEKGKDDLEARVAWLSDEVKLQTAPLLALRLELEQARSDTETMRQRLKEERRISRLRDGDYEKANVDANQRIERLEFDLNETTKALQRESLKASMFEGMFQDASSTAKVLQDEVEQRKADAKIIAQELTLMRMGDDNTPECQVQDQEIARKSLGGKQQQAVIATLKASIEKLQADKARSDDAVKELQNKHREEAEGRELAVKAAKERADSFVEENKRLSLVIDRQDEEQRQRDRERHDREVQHENETCARNMRSKSLRARLCRTLDELCEAEEAGELSITCLECAKLFKDPHVMAPCGHALCADCSRRGFDGGSALGQPGEESSGWVLGGGTKRSSCPLCTKQGGGGSAEEGRCVGSAPSRELATLVTKFVFRRQLLESLREIAALLWQE
eukprot:g10554.t1